MRICGVRFGGGQDFRFGVGIAADAAVLEEDVAEGVGQGFQGAFPQCWLQLTFPHRDAMPAHGGQPALPLGIAQPVALYFGLPEGRVGLGKGEMLAVPVPVPKTSVDEDDRPVARQHDVRASGKPRVMQPEAEASAEEELPHQQFRLGVLSPYGRHAAMALLLGHFVHRNWDNRHLPLPTVHQDAVAVGERVVVVISMWSRPDEPQVQRNVP